MSYEIKIYFIRWNTMLNAGTICYLGLSELRVSCTRLQQDEYDEGGLLG